jgi:uncharacterized iron-regulated membrane protein
LRDAHPSDSPRSGWIEAASLLRLLRRLHAWTGLFCAPALLAAAVAGLTATWHAHAATDFPRRISERPFAAQAGEDDLSLARRIQREAALPLTQTPEDWLVGRDESGALRFELYTANGRHWLRFAEPAGLLRIESERVDLATFVLRMHAYSSALPSSGLDPRILAWSWYMTLATLGLAGFALSGIALWLGTRPRDPVSLGAFVAGWACCLGLVWSVW